MEGVRACLTSLQQQLDEKVDELERAKANHADEITKLQEDLELDRGKLQARTAEYNESLSSKETTIKNLHKEIHELQQQQANAIQVSLTPF